MYTHQGLDPVKPTVDSGAPQFTRCNSNISVNFSSTLEGSNLQFSCVEGYLPSDVISATCHSNGSWVPDPTSHMCTTAVAGLVTSTKLKGILILKLLQDLCMKIYNHQRPCQVIHGRKQPLNSKRMLPMAQYQYGQHSNSQNRMLFLLLVRNHYVQIADEFIM